MLSFVTGNFYWLTGAKYHVEMVYRLMLMLVMRAFLPVSSGYQSAKNQELLCILKRQQGPPLAIQSICLTGVPNKFEISDKSNWHT